jgi:hypothetical protein
MLVVLLQLTETSGRLGPLKAGTRLVTAEERGRVASEFSSCMDAWAKRRRMFKSIWYASPCLLICHAERHLSAWRLRAACTAGRVAGAC